MKKTVFILLISFICIGLIGCGSKEESQKMTGWKAYSLNGTVKRINYNTGAYLEFNAFGNLVKDGMNEVDEPVTHEYISETRYLNYRNAYDVIFLEQENQRKEKWVTDTQEDLALYYTFDNKGRISEFQDRQNYGDVGSRTYKYSSDVDLLPSSMVEEFSWESGNVTNTYTYEYTQTDEYGNWTERKVKLEKKESDYENESVSSRSYTETAFITYYTPEEISVQKKELRAQFAQNNLPDHTNNDHSRENSQNEMSKGTKTILSILFLLVAAVMAYFFIFSYPKTKEKLEKIAGFSFMPANCIPHIITACIGIAAMILALIFKEQFTPIVDNIWLVALGLIIVVFGIVFLINRKETKPGLYKAGYHSVMTVVMLSIGVATVAVVWMAITIAICGGVIYLILKAMFGGGSGKKRYKIDCPYLDNKDMALNSHTCSKGVIGEKCSAVKTGKCNKGVKIVVKY